MIAAALAFNLLVLLLAFVGMMVTFMGGTGYLPVLLILLGVALPLLLVMILAGITRFAVRHSWRNALPAAWSLLPQWLVVAAWLGIALIFCGELALIVTLQLAEEAPRAWQHLPLLAGLGAVVAFCLLFAWGRDEHH